MDDALVHRAVAHEAHGDFLAPASLRREPRAGRDRDRRADGAGVAEKAEGQIAHVHLAAAAERIAVAPADALAEELVEIRALGAEGPVLPRKPKDRSPMCILPPRPSE